MVATRTTTRRSATRHTRQYTPPPSRSHGSTIEPAPRTTEAGSCTRTETRTAGGVSATVITDETTDEREYIYGWFNESPLDPDGIPMTFFCTVPEIDRDRPQIRLHFREITRAVHRLSHRNNLHRYFELVLRVPRQVFDPLAGVWVDRWQVIGRTKPIPVPLSLTFQTAVQEMAVIDGRQCLIACFHHTRDTVQPIVSGQMANSTNQPTLQTPQQPHIHPLGNQWLGNLGTREADPSSTLDDDMERIMAGIRDIL